MTWEAELKCLFIFLIHGLEEDDKDFSKAVEHD
jgi:hypothetical protein